MGTVALIFPLQGKGEEEGWKTGVRFGGRCQMGGAEDNWAVSLSQEGEP